MSGFEVREDYIHTCYVYPNASLLVDELFDLAHLGDRRQDIQNESS